MEVREIADFVVRPRLLAIAGVAQVIPIGGEVRQYRVTPNVAIMQALDITNDQIERAISSFGTNSGGGFVDQHGREYLIRNVGLTRQIEDLGNTVVVMRDGQSILLKQVARVDFAPRVKRGDAGYNGKPAVIVSVQKQPAADTVALTRTIESALQEMQRTLPAGVTVTNVQFRQATFIETSIANVQRVLVEAAIVVAIVLFIFLLNARATFISLTAIPISILITVLVFSAMGMTINTMTLGGIAIAIGELVDDAVVDVENILRRLKENRALPEPRSVIEVITQASQEVRSGIVYATAIVVLVFVPLFALPGIEGRLFTPLGIAYVVSILASLLTSVTVTPVLAYYLLSGRASSSIGDSFVVRQLKTGNRALLAWAFDHHRLLLGTVAIAVVIAAFAATRLPRAFLPPFNEGTLVLSLQYNPGISLAESHRLGLIAERLLAEVPEVKSVGRRTGRAELDEHAEGVHFSEIDVDLTPSTRDKSEIYAQIRERLSGLPASVAIGQPISHRLDHLQSGIRAQVVLKIFGPDIEVLRRLAEIHARASCERTRAGRPSGREAGADSAGSRSGRPRARRTLRRDAGGRDAGARSAVERAPSVADRRWRAPFRRGDAALRSGPVDDRSSGSAGPDADRLCAAQLVGGCRRDRRTQPDPARGNTAPHRRLRQWRRSPRHGGDCRRYSTLAGRANTARKATRQAWRVRSRRRRKPPGGSACYRSFHCRRSFSFSTADTSRWFSPSSSWAAFRLR